MAISCEKVYSGTGDQIYPETADKAVTVLAKDTTLDKYLEELAKSISEVQGADQIAKSLKFKIDYLATNTSDVTKVKELEDQPETNQWGENFVLPSVRLLIPGKEPLCILKDRILKMVRNFMKL